MSAKFSTLFNKENIPYYNKINQLQAEIAVLTEKVGNNVDSENYYRLQTLRTMVSEYETLGKLEKRNERVAEIQKSINDLIDNSKTKIKSQKLYI